MTHMFNSITDLDAIFGNYRADEQRSSWETAKLSLPVGTLVSGRVVARFHFGVFCDIGVGFPALLEIIRMRDMTPERYRNTEWCPVGTELTATVTGCGDAGRQIGLSQIDD